MEENVRLLIETKGCEAFATVKNEEAWEYFQRERPHVCLMDIHLPSSEFDGIELLRKIREIDKDTKCIFITRIEDQEIKEKADALGVTEYFEKPLDGDEFDRLIEYVT